MHLLSRELKFFPFILLRTLLRTPKTPLFCFQLFSHSLRKTARGGVSLDPYLPCFPFSRWPELANRPARLFQRSHSTFNCRSKIPTSLGYAGSDPVGTVNLPCAALPRVTEHGSRVTSLATLSTHGTPTPRPTLPRRSPLARRNRARHSRFAPFNCAPRWRRAFFASPDSSGSTLLDRNRRRPW